MAILQCPMMTCLCCSAGQVQGAHQTLSPMWPWQSNQEDDPGISEFTAEGMGTYGTAFSCMIDERKMIVKFMKKPCSL